MKNSSVRAPSPAEAGARPAGPSRRVVSIDVVRGLAIAGMLVVNNPGIRDAVPTQLRHSEWNGVTFADSIFPLFLFAIGLSLPFSSKGTSFRKVLRRSLVLLLLGFALGSLKRGELFAGPGVLQRIAVAYLLGWAILRLPARVQLAACVVLLAAVAAAFELAHPPGVVPGSWERATHIAAFVDERLIGHFSTEGILGTLVSSVNLVGGAFLGRLLKKLPPREALPRVWGWAFASLVLGIAGSLAFPINKPLWTPTYAVFAQGVSCAYLGVAVWLADIRGARRGIKPLQVLGANPILIYLLSTALGYLLLNRRRGPVMAAIAQWTGATAATLIYAAAVTLLWWAVADRLFDRKVFVRI